MDLRVLGNIWTQDLFNAESCRHEELMQRDDPNTNEKESVLGKNALRLYGFPV